MLFEHWIYSTALAIIVGMVYYRFTKRDYSWIIIASAYAPDLDKIAPVVLKKIGISVMIFGNPIGHADFHNIASLLVYAGVAALILHPIGIRLKDSFIFAGIGFAAHLFEDALVFNPAYAFFWPLSSQQVGIGIFNYTRNWYSIADKEVLFVGLILLLLSVIVRTAYEGPSWIRKSISITTRPNSKTFNLSKNK